MQARERSERAQYSEGAETTQRDAQTDRNPITVRQSDVPAELGVVPDVYSRLR